MVFFFNRFFGSRHSKEDEKYFSKAVSFKIAANDFGKFDGKPEHWYAFKNKTMSTLCVAGISSILDKTKPTKDQEGNCGVYYLFEGAKNDGSASQCQLLALKASVLFWIRQSQPRIKIATTESTIYSKVQPMMVQPPILSEATRRQRWEGCLACFEGSV